VQGVGFRPWVYRLATQEGVAGRVRNDAAGVTIDAFGPAEVLEEFSRRLTRDAPDAAEIRELHERPIPAERLDAFSIVDSITDADRRIAIPPDLATCPACLHDISNASDRRFEYAFTNCTNCGPRFTIACDTPYDRAATTMAAFRMCEACQEEYASVQDRRFHAQANACPTCGPALTLATAEGRAIDSRSPISDAAAALQLGKIVAVKGLGGFHLACDATASEVVARVRLRKGRDAKPFAVMVNSLHAAHAIAELTEADERLLTAVERPIVLVRRRIRCALAPNVAAAPPPARGTGAETAGDDLRESVGGAAGVSER
jgi:hydrogenase maturation protein HypF